MTQNANDQIMSVLLDSEDVTWQQILMDLVNKNQMNPWDIDLALLTGKFLEVIRAMKENDLRIPAKMILAAAVLLRIKSTRLVKEDLDALDQLFASAEEDDEVQGLFDEDVDKKTRELQIPDLVPRTPSPRKRKVSIYDLVFALEKALGTKQRRVNATMPDIDLVIPAKTVDISRIIKSIYFKIKNFFTNSPDENLTFSKLVPSDSREDKVYTFIPLLHLTNQGRVDIEQSEPFGEIQIMMRSKNEVKEEMESSE